MLTCRDDWTSSLVWNVWTNCAYFQSILSIISHKYLSHKLSKNSINNTIEANFYNLASSISNYDDNQSDLLYHKDLTLITIANK